MANSADRARFFLEQSVPELQELLRKDILSKDEVSAVAKKRSEFEHIINARGAQLSDYIRYLAYEQNLEILKKKRIRRLGIKNFGYSGPRRAFFLFERATRKFPSELRLWMQYLEYAKSTKAYKRVGKILTAVLRLHPTNPDLWIVAAKYSVDGQGEYGAARSCLQRGLRFCPKDKALWLAHVRLEMRYILKTTENLEALGTKTSSTPVGTLAENDGIITGQKPSDRTALGNMAGTPALTGAIPIAIFDSAMEEFNGDSVLAEQFFDIFAEFHQLTCSSKILKHVVFVLGRQVPATANWALCSFKLPLVGIEHSSPKFPMALRHALQLLRAAIVQQRKTNTRYTIAQKAAMALLPLATDDGVDREIQKVIASVLKQTVQIMGCTRTAEVVSLLQSQNRPAEAQCYLKFGLKHNPAHRALQAKFIELQQLASAK